MLFHQILYIFQYFLILKFVVISAFEVQHPTLDFTLTVNYQQLLKFIKHSEVLGPESPFDWHYSMAISSEDSPMLVDIVHHLIDHHKRINLLVIWIDFDEQYALSL